MKPAIILCALFATSAMADTSPPMPADTGGALVVAPRPDDASIQKIFTEINFTRGQSQLDSLAQQRLASTIREASLRGKIDQVQILTWGDSDSAASQASAAEVKLVAERNQALISYFSGKPFPTKAYNLAQRPSALQELLNSGDMRLRNTINSAGYASPRLNSSRALVLVLMK